MTLPVHPPVLSLELYLAAVDAGEVPVFPPQGTCGPHRAGLGDFEAFMALSQGREACTSRAMWALVDQYWTGQLARWLGARRCLEIMAGAGWLAKALHGHGVDLIASDDTSWDNDHRQMQRLVPMEALEARAAVDRLGTERDVLIVSWPPYECDAILAACEAWGPDRPIVYIGEWVGGCNAPDAFFKRFQVDPTAPAIELPRWPGLHDNLHIGHWTCSDPAG